MVLVWCFIGNNDWDDSIMAKKTKALKYSPARLYVFQPKDNIDPKLVAELTDVIQIGVSGHTLQVMSPELQEQFVELEVA